MPEDIPTAEDSVRDRHRHRYASKVCVRCPERATVGMHSQQGVDIEPAPARPKKAQPTPKKPRPQEEVLEYDVDPGPSGRPKKASERRKPRGRDVEVIELVPFS